MMRFIKRNNFLLLFLSIVSITVYLLTSRLTYRFGFPLDDAWIHQTYARNLIFYGKWVYTGVETSAGSTSPFWTILLSIGYLLQIHYLIWVIFLGVVILTLLAILSVKIVRLFSSKNELQYGLISGIVVIFEWHLVWASLSGMETILFAFIALLFFYIILLRFENWFVIGLLIGVAFWIRPDGITLLGPALFVIVFNRWSISKKTLTAMQLLLGVGVILVPYFLMMVLSSGRILPNTFFAKQTEYQVLQSQPFVLRYLDQLKIPLIGIGIVLLPGFLAILYTSISEKRWRLLSGIIWVLGFLFLFAWRLPVTYQHGRYVIPVIPVFIVWSFIGLLEIEDRVKMLSNVKLLHFGGGVLITIILISFWMMGARAYGQDVAVVETEMVETAKWISLNLDKSALIAAHDIGALGYFAPQNLVDLAGLVSPDVIPFLRDEKELSEYLDIHHVNYLVTFPSWYPSLVKDRKIIYRSDGAFSPKLGGENMTIYLWNY